MRLGTSLCILLLTGASAAYGAIIDDFDDGVDDGWTHLAPTPGATFDASGLRYEIEVPPTGTSLSPARAWSVRSGATELFGEVTVGADLVEWDDRDNHLVGVSARSTATTFVTQRGYALVLNGGDVDALQLVQVTFQVPAVLASVPVEISPGSNYRLLLSVSDESPVMLTGRLYHAEDLRTPLATVTYADATAPVYFSGYTGLFVHDRSIVPDQDLWATFENFFATDPASDTDADTLGDGMELAIGTDPLDADSDDDGLLDGEEIGTGSFGAQLALEAGADGVQSAVAADLDGDGDADVLAASHLRDELVWFENHGDPAVEPWSTHTISSAADGAVSVHAADLDGDGDLDVLSASLNDDRIAWYENDGTPEFGAWTARDISLAADGARSVAAGDLDGDLDIDVLSASINDGKVTWYQNDGTPANGGWVARTITSSANGAISVAAADIDSDGDLDVLSAALDDAEIAWHENDGSPAVGAWPERIISNSAIGVASVFAVDLDGIGFLDVLSASFGDDTIAWYQNDGTPAVGPWAERAISTAADGATSVFAADLDGDTDVDVLSAASATGEVVWFENDATPTTGPWTARSVAIVPGGGVAALAVDVDGDPSGDFDVVVSSVYDDRIRWFENDGSPATGPWTARAVSTAADATVASYPVDLDRDGDTDLVSASFADDAVEWSLNPGFGTPASWAVFPISSAADGATSVFAVDLDRDFDIDVLSASFLDDTIAWYENDGTPTVGAWPEHTVSTAADGAWSVSAADLDGDGDLDVVSGSTLDDTVAWYENDGSPALGPWLAHTVSSSVDGDFQVLGLDVDGDFDADIVAASQTDDEITWFAQRNVADPQVPDSDDDGLPDSAEVAAGTDALASDSDADGLGDGFEVGYGLNPLVAGDQDLDPDADGLTTLEEQSAGTNPVVADTDGDAVNDGADNCRIAWNPDQSDTGSVLGGPPDGTGDACQCGDLDGNGVVSPADVLVFRDSLASPEGNPLTAEALAKCSVVDDGDCDVLDVSVLRRALAAPPLPPGIQPVCSGLRPPDAFPTVTDMDGDGLGNAADHCPSTFNPAQSDSGGVLDEAADGVGDACQCGDVDNDGIVDSADVEAYRSSLADPDGYELTPLGVEKCSVIDDSAPCEVLHVAVIVRALEDPALPPGIAPVCSAAAPP